MEKFFTTFEVAKICQVSPASVSRWIREGKLASSVTIGGHHRIGAEALRALLKASRMPIPPELNPPSGMRKVLIADQDPKTRKKLRRCLEQSFEALSVEEAGDGFEAGWKAHALKPHLILLDYSIVEGAAGAEPDTFLKNLTAAADAAIILTGNPKDINSLRKFSGAIKAFVTKPFDVELLNRQARECFYGESEGRSRAKAG